MQLLKPIYGSKPQKGLVKQKKKKNWRAKYEINCLRKNIQISVTFKMLISCLTSWKSLHAVLKCVSVPADLHRRKRHFGRCLVCTNSRLDTRERFGARRESLSLPLGAAPRQVERGTTKGRGHFPRDGNKRLSSSTSITRLKKFF